MNVTSLLEGHSKAMYSTYFLYKPNNILFDCGEGAATNLGSKVFAADKIFLSHGHLDHCSGIPNFLFARSGGRGDNAKPLTIYCPVGDVNCWIMRNTCNDLSGHGEPLGFELTWKTLSPGDKVEIGGGKYITAFETKHIEPSPQHVAPLTLGYRIHEQRKKLKPEYLGLSHEQIVELIKQHGREALTNVEEGTVLTYSGDTHVLPVESYGKPQLLMHEATFLDRTDVKYDTHSVLEDVVRMAKEVNPKALLLYHFSTRYSPAQVSLAVQKAVEEAKLEVPVWIQYGSHVWECGDEVLS